jgi:hypothetical protein
MIGSNNIYFEKKIVIMTGIEPAILTLEQCRNVTIYH